MKLSQAFLLLPFEILAITAILAMLRYRLTCEFAGLARVYSWLNGFYLCRSNFKIQSKN